MDSLLEYDAPFSLAGLFEDAQVVAPPEAESAAPAVLSMQDVFPSPREEIVSWHPNRVLMSVCQLLYARMSQQYTYTKSKVKRSPRPYDVLRAWVRDGEVQPGAKNGLARKNGRDAYRRVVAAVTGQTAREVSAKTSARWQATSSGQIDSWAQMAALFAHDDVQPFVHDLVNHEGRTRKCMKNRQEAVKGADANYVVHGYGVSLCYNTMLGQNDPQVIKLMQTGVNGEALRKAMGDMPLYREALADAWDYFVGLGRSCGLPVVAVGIEHSEHGDQPGRVHFHVNMNIDVRGGILTKSPKEVAVSKSVFEWQGLTPHIRAVQVRRTTSSAITAAVTQAYYYVAGPKSSSILKRCSLELFEEPFGCIGSPLYLRFSGSQFII